VTLTPGRCTPLRPVESFIAAPNSARPLLDWDTRGTSRFSHPTLPFPVLYLADGKFTSFWECFGDELNDQPQAETALYADRSLAQLQWVRFDIKPPLSVVDVTNPRHCAPWEPTALRFSPTTQSLSAGRQLSCTTLTVSRASVIARGSTPIGTVLRIRPTGCAARTERFGPRKESALLQGSRFPAVPRGERYRAALGAHPSCTRHSTPGNCLGNLSQAL